MQLTSLLSSSDNISKLCDSDLANQLIQIGDARIYKDGGILFQKGDPPEYLYVIIHGEVQITSQTSGGKETIWNTLSKGEIFGELSMLDKGARTTDAYAQPNSEIVLVSAPQFNDFLNNIPNAYPSIISMMCKRFRYISDNAEAQLLLNNEQRLAKKLLYLQKQNNKKVINISQESLSKTIGTSRETVNIILKEFERKNILSIKNKKIIILSIDKLTKILINSD